MDLLAKKDRGEAKPALNTKSTQQKKKASIGQSDS